MIVDVFLYCGEAEMAKARVRELAPHVDFFYLVEADFTFSGKKREISFPAVLPELQRLARMYRPERPAEIRPFIITSEALEAAPLPEAEIPEENSDSWRREAFCRDAPRQEIAKHFGREDDIIFVSDCDEIPDFRTFELDFLARRLKFLGPHCLIMNFYYYNFSSRKKVPWCGTLVFSGDFLHLNWEELRRKRCELPLLYSGWHLSYFMTPQEMAKKIDSFSHQEFNLPEVRDEGALLARLKAKEDIFSRGEIEDLLSIEPTLCPLPRTYYYFPSYMKE